MPRRVTILTLPPKVRKQLHARLVSTNFGRLVELSAWLTQLGHPVGKSAIGAYAKKNRELIAAEQGRPAARLRADALLSCLQVAASTGPEQTITARAQRYAAWLLARLS